MLIGNGNDRKEVEKLNKRGSTARLKSANGLAEMIPKHLWSCQSQEDGEVICLTSVATRREGRQRREVEMQGR